MSKLINFFTAILRRIPVLGSLAHYSKDAHATALQKFAFLWILATLPVIFSVIFSSVPGGPGTIAEKFLARISPGFSLREQFVYAASFLAPVLYIAIDNIRKNSAAQDLGGPKYTISRNVPHSYTAIFVISLLTLIAAAAAHARIAAGDPLDSIFFFALLNDYSLLIYGWALFAWYVSLLDETQPKDPDFTGAMRTSEFNRRVGLEARLQVRD